MKHIDARHFDGRTKVRHRLADVGGQQPRIGGKKHTFSGFRADLPGETAGAVHGNHRFAGAGAAQQASGTRKIALDHGSLRRVQEVAPHLNGLVEFAAQFLQLAYAAEGGPLRQNTAEALAAFEGRAPAEPLVALRKAWTGFSW